MKKANLVSYLSSESTLPGPSASAAYVSTVEKKKEIVDNAVPVTQKKL